ncbi:MBL fold metallo-hydrolase [Alicyclobacillus vulcanalis]|uniref:Glyoxylase, beta-lactamase superfamily II n=1 Tax=Alicyclobacillus vulcanalis TaxID=252246 RepID=A0A1N7KTQ4_9BACL|nr:MBL fold metallo-hydrolase [Alicyclobacillus vulcanalis]SIS64998.1 Glyoxylase, beta-lactamase superfamily II [Alicyclobacillus vulcanalis]
MANAGPLEQVSPGVWRMCIPYPNVLPYGTVNVYVVADEGEALVVDAGAVGDHVEQLARGLRDIGVQRVRALVATHYHVDHTAGVRDMTARFGAPAFMHPLDVAAFDEKFPAARGTFAPCPERLRVGHRALDVIHQPGHTHGHLHLWLPDVRAIFVGDHLVEEGSVWVGPPDGHMEDYFRALEAVTRSEAEVALPGHGPAIRRPQAAAKRLLERRRMREEQILHILNDGPKALEELTRALYPRLDPRALPFARHTAIAHLEHLESQGFVRRTMLSKDWVMRYARTEE